MTCSQERLTQISLHICSLISIICFHEEALDTWPSIEHPFKTDQTVQSSLGSHHFGGFVTLQLKFGWLGRAMVLGSFQCRGVLLLWHMVGQGPAVLAAGAGWMGCFFFIVLFHLVYPIFLF